jgi:hypothetical protein
MSKAVVRDGIGAVPVYRVARFTLRSRAGSSSSGDLRAAGAGVWDYEDRAFRPPTGHKSAWRARGRALRRGELWDELSQPQLAAGRVSQPAIPAVWHVVRRQRELDAGLAQALVVTVDVIGREEHSPGNPPFAMSERTCSATSESITGDPGTAISTTAKSGWLGGLTVSQRNPPSSAIVTSSRTSQPSLPT